MAFRVREEWLEAAIKALRPLFKSKGYEVPVTIRVSVGFPQGKRTAIGQCFSKSSTTDKYNHIFVHPKLADPVEILAVLVHELVHVVDDCQHGHKKEFIAIAKPLGLQGKWTATTAGDVLKATLVKIATDLGKFPHGAMIGAEATEKEKPGSRLLKVVCEESGYNLRTTMKWLDQYGPPICPCHKKIMTTDNPEED